VVSFSRRKSGKRPRSSNTDTENHVCPGLKSNCTSTLIHANLASNSDIKQLPSIFPTLENNKIWIGRTVERTLELLVFSTYATESANYPFVKINSRRVIDYRGKQAARTRGIMLDFIRTWIVSGVRSRWTQKAALIFIVLSH